jgi:uncharacterized membrane protein
MAAAGACGAAAFGVTLVLPGLIGIALAIMAGGLVYVAAVRLFGLIAADEASRIAGMVETRLPATLRRLVPRLVGLIAAPGRKAEG